MTGVTTGEEEMTEEEKEEDELVEIETVDEADQDPEVEGEGEEVLLTEVCQEDVTSPDQDLGLSYNLANICNQSWYYDCAHFFCWANLVILRCISFRI